MKSQRWGLYAVALAILVVGLVWAGVPASTLLIAALVLVCPLMMLSMHGGGHTGHDHGVDHDQVLRQRYESTPGHDGDGRRPQRQDTLR
jgi:DUF2933 family protein